MWAHPDRVPRAFEKLDPTVLPGQSISTWLSKFDVIVDHDPAISAAFGEAFLEDYERRLRETPAY